jgi:monoamine oxidase
MAAHRPKRIIVIGAGAAGLMIARILARAGLGVELIEARDRLGGRIWELDSGEFGYRAEGGAEFVHGEATVTRSLMDEAGLSLFRSDGERWNVRGGEFSRRELFAAGFDEIEHKLAALKHDLPIAQFLNENFGASKYAALRESILRMVEGYDAADPARASTMALRDEWLGGEGRAGGRIAESYGALIAFLAEECRKHGVAIHLDAPVRAIEWRAQGAIAHGADGNSREAEAIVVTVPLPNLRELEFRPAIPEKMAAVAKIGYGDVIKILLRFTDAWWARARGRDLRRLSFVISDAFVPTWWTQYPRPHPVLTGWLAGPRAAKLTRLSQDELVARSLESLATIFDRPARDLERELVAAKPLHWGQDPFARGAYSYATPESQAAQAELSRPAGAVFFSGEAFYRGKDMGTVEAALAHAADTAKSILAMPA